MSCLCYVQLDLLQTGTAYLSGFGCPMLIAVPLIVTCHVAAYIKQQMLTAEMSMQIITFLYSKTDQKQ